MAVKKNKSIGFRPKLVSLAVASCFATSTALANPTGAQVANGQVSIIQNGALLQITNSPNSIINWQSFSIGASEITRFIQQSQASAVLNRVAAGNPSFILGALQSNGRVFLVNPSGITFGAGSQVDVAGLVATSLNLSDADFLAGKLKFTDGATAGSVVNQGNITAGTGGEVYLVGNAVRNDGIIKSPNGDVLLAAGNSVELVSPGTPNLRVEITAPTNEAKNLGQIVVDSGRAGIYAGLITNSGSIRADSVVSQGGKILLKATKSATLESTSVLSAQGKGGGEIKVLADESAKVAGRLDASAPSGGNGGFIETSAHNVGIAEGTIVTTAAPYGKTGTWLIDPVDFTIGAGGDITGANLILALGTSSVTIQTATGSNTAANLFGTTGVNGDIFVNQSVTWSNSNSLTLLANRNINVSSPITNSGSGSINMYAGWDGASNTSPAVTAGTGDINFARSVSTAGNMTLFAGNNINLTPTTNSINVHADGSQTINAGGIITLAGGTNVVAKITAGNSGTGAGGGQDITAGGIVLTGGNGTTTSGIADIQQDGTAAAQLITVTGGGTVSLTGGSGVNNSALIQSNGVSQTIDFASGGSLNLTGGTGTNNDHARIYAATGTQTISGQPAITLTGGSGGLIDDGNFAQIRAQVGTQTIDAGTTQLLAGTNIGTNNFANISAPTQVITVTGDLTLTGGNSDTPTGANSGAGARIGGIGGATTGPTDLTLTVHGNVTLNGGSVANAGASIGSTFIGGVTTDITMNVDGNVTLNPGVTDGSARIGSPSSAIAGGNISIMAGGAIALNDNVGGVGTFIRTAGNVSLNAGSGISEGTYSAILANGLEANGGSGTVSLTGPNLVNTLAGSATGGFFFKNSQDLVIDSVGSTNGITVNGSQSEIQVEVSNGNLTVSKNVAATGAGSFGSASISLTASGALGVTSGAQVVATGGNGDEGGGSAMVALTAGSTIDVSGATIQALGGYGTCCGGGGGAASITLTGPGGITVRNGSILSAVGGNGFSSSGSFGGGRGGNAIVSLTSTGGSIDVQSGNTISATGGNGGPSGSFTGNIRGGNAQVTMTAAGLVTMAGTVTATGGAGGGASGNSFVSARGGDATVTLNGASGVTVGGIITATGGSGGFARSSFCEGGITCVNADASGGNASVTLTSLGAAGTGVNTTGSAITVTGGAGGNAQASYQAQANGGGAFVLMNAIPGITVGGAVSGTGGNGGFASGGNNAGAYGGGASVQMFAGSGSTIAVNGPVTMIGGNGGSGHGGAYFAGAGGSANIYLNAPGGVITVGSPLSATGGPGGVGTSGSLSFGRISGEWGGGASVGLFAGSINVNNSVAVTGGAGANASGSAPQVQGGGGGGANVNVTASSGNLNVSGAVSVLGGAGGNANGGSSNYAYGGGSANVRLTSPVAVNVTGAGITVRGGNAGTGASSGGTGGRAMLTVDGGEGLPFRPPAGSVTFAAPVQVTGGNGIFGGNAVLSAGSATNIDVTSPGAIQVDGGLGTVSGGTGQVILSAAGNITVGGNIGTTGIGASIETQSGIYLNAGNAIIGGAGILSASYDPSRIAPPQVISLQAVNGVGQIATPIHLASDGPDLSFINSGSSGDIALSFVSGSCIVCTLPNTVGITGDLNGLLNTNPTGTYSIVLESGTNFELQIPFFPNGGALLPGQNVAVQALNGDLTFGPGAGVLTFGGGTISATGNNINVLAGAAPTLIHSSGLMTVNATGTITVQGGNTGSGNWAQVSSDGGQTISAAAINVIGGSNGFNNFARVANNAGAQTITGSPVITLMGGSGGLADQGNFAQIVSFGTQDITSGSMTLLAGAGGGFSDFATIQSPSQIITVNGDLTLTGGNSQSGVNQGGGARIGGLGGANASATNLSLTVSGNVNMTGGSVANAGSAIGSAYQGGQTTDITMNVGGGVTLTPGTVAGSRIGAPNGGATGGNISVTAGGPLTLNGGTVGTLINTLGNVNLQASSISEAGNAAIIASNLVANAGSSINLPGNNSVATFGATSTSGNVVFNDSLPLLVTGIGAGGSVSLTDLGSIGLTAPIIASGTLALNSGGTIVNFSGAASALTAPSISLAAVNGVGLSTAPVYVSGAGSLAASNSGVGDIVITNPTGNFTVGTGGWQLSNLGGSYIVGGNTVTLNSGAPGNAPMFVAAGTDINIAPSGYSNGGIAVLTAVNNVNVNGNLTANDLAMIASNQVNVNGATASGTNSASVVATHLNVKAGSTPAQLKAGTALGIVAGDVTVTGGSGTDAFAEISVGPAGTMDVTTVVSPISTGNINLKGGTGSGAYARIFGDPDVGNLLLPVEVGGVINMDAGTGSGAYARIESASVNSIHVDFTGVTSGGYFVNGTESAVSNGLSGFFAGGQPAVLDQNFFVTYGGVTSVPAFLPPAVQQAIDLVAAVTSNQTTLTQTTNTSGDSGNSGGGGGVTTEEKKKPLPICGK